MVAIKERRKDVRDRGDGIKVSGSQKFEIKVCSIQSMASSTMERKRPPAHKFQGGEAKRARYREHHESDAGWTKQHGRSTETTQAPSNDGGSSTEKPFQRMSKGERAALHAAQPHRTTLLPSHALLQSLLPKWEQARRAELKPEERKRAVRELWEGVQGRVGEISRGHKGGRILQTVSRIAMFL